MKHLPIAVVLFGCSILASSATLTTVDFETQGSNAPAAFSGHTDSPLGIGVATFSGGQLLRNEAGGADMSAVYATTNQHAGNYTDPLVISFSQPVSQFSLLLTDEIPDTYKISDNHGVSISGSVNGNTSVTFSLQDSGIQQVNVSTGNTTIWDFAIDNVSFTSAAVTPEPTFLPLVGLLLGAALLRKSDILGWRRA